MTSLNPAFSPRRRGNVRCIFGIYSGGISPTVSRKTKTGHRHFLSPGERIKGEGGRKHQVPESKKKHGEQPALEL